MEVFGGYNGGAWCSTCGGVKGEMGDDVRRREERREGG